MQKTKVGIVEDEFLIGMGIAGALKELGYDVPKVAGNYTQALEMTEREKPDILIIDIMLGGHKDGIDLAWKIKKEFRIPFIFLTANSDIATVERAKKVESQAYLVKPFQKNELYTTIEICLHNYAQSQKQQQKPEGGNYLVNDSLFIKQGNYFHKIAIDDILYLKTDNIYLNVYTREGKFLVRSSLQDYIDLIGAKHIVKVHRSYGINTRHIQKINTEFLVVNNAEIPIARAFREAFLASLKLG